MKVKELTALLASAEENLKLYAVSVTSYRSYDTEYLQPLHTELVPEAGIFATAREASQAMEQAARLEKNQPDSGHSYLFHVEELTFYDPTELLDDVSCDYDDEYDLDNDDIHAVYMAADYNDYADHEIMVEYPFGSIEGAVLAEWQWERYLGYARRFVSLRLGQEGETERLCVDCEQTYRSNYSVVATREELEGLSERDKHQLLVQRLSEGGWKWTCDFLRIDNHIDNLIDQF